MTPLLPPPPKTGINNQFFMLTCRHTLTHACLHICTFCPCWWTSSSSVHSSRQPQWNKRPKLHFNGLRPPISIFKRAGNKMKLSPSFAPVLFCLLWPAEVFWRNTCSWAGLANCNKTMKNNSSNRAKGITKESWWLLPYLTAWNASYNLFFFGIFLYSCKNAQCYHIQMSFFSRKI